MSIPIAPTADPYAERWRQWQSANDVSRRNGEWRARLVFTAIFAALAVWLGLQLLSLRLWT